MYVAMIRLLLWSTRGESGRAIFGRERGRQHAPLGESRQTETVESEITLGRSRENSARSGLTGSRASAPKAVIRVHCAIALHRSIRGRPSRTVARSHACSLVPHRVCLACMSKRSF